MIKNYFKVAWRNLLKNKIFSAINISGLAIGISASLVIYLLVSYHFSFDKFEKDNNRIYRVVTDINFSGEVYHNAGVTSPLGPTITNELTGLEAVVPFRTWDGPVKITVPGASQEAPVIFKKQEDVVFTGENYFSLIGYTWIAGSPLSAVKQPYQTVLTVSRAKQYFPKLTPEQIIGRELVFDDTIHTTVSAVVNDITSNTDFSFKTFISSITLEKTSLKPNDFNEWNNTNSASQLLVKLSTGTSVAKIEKAIVDLYSKYNKKEEGDNSKTSFRLQPLNDLHFSRDYGGYRKPIANKPTLYGLLAVAAFLLLLGCINFINLTTANASQRTKEIGVKKTIGSSKQQLIFQFLSETFLLTFIATLLSVILTPLLLKVFSGFIPDDLHFSIIKQPSIILFLVVLIIIVTFLSGFYPALILSGYKPVMVLKNQAFSRSGKTRQAWLRKSLTVTQFIIAQVFIMATILVSKQINYTLHKNLGFKKDAVIYFSTNYFDTVRTNKQTLLKKLHAIPGIEMISLSTSPPSSSNTWSSTFKYKDGKKEIETDVQLKFVDSNYLKLYDLKLLAGSFMAQTDTVNSFIINETYARHLGFQQPQEAIGKIVEWSDKKKPIIGVIKDFHQKSLHEPIKPLALGSWTNSERNFNILLQSPGVTTGNWSKTIGQIEKSWKGIYPNDDFTYSFFDEDIAKYYEEEKNISSLLQWATGLAVFISCLGLLGLVIYTTTQRTKEIGVRKVLGATASQIVSLISLDFILLVLIAFIVAAPVAWFGVNKWLQNFAYRTQISWWVFLLACVVMVAIALLTLSLQTIRAAIANPVKSLKSE
jgi:putative ABC transport system permease protein